MTAPHDWWKTFFSGLSVEMWLRAVPDDVTRREAEFLREKLQVPSGGAILDVPCGGGRHALELASQGYRVTGVDLSRSFLEVARTQAAERQLTIRWEEREMLDLPWPETFDGAFCFGNSFGYDEDAGNARFFAAVSRALKPGSRFVLDYPAVAESLLPVLVPRTWYEMGDILFLRNGRYDPPSGRIEGEHTYIRGSQVEKRQMSQRIYTYRELCELLARAGFTQIEGYGSLDNEPFALGSKRLLLVARKGS
jgi:SAM-dependent methyltransferase